MATAWLAGAGLVLIAVPLYALRSPAAGPLAATGALVFAGGLAAYAVRHALFVRSLSRAETALIDGELSAARDILAPLLDRFPGLPAVARTSGLLLYAGGDPLSAATLLERAATALRRDPPLVVTLVASYAALNKAGDARRAAAMLPEHPEVRLALAWAELVALGGDRARGAALAEALPEDTASRAAMAAVLRAIGAARRGDGDGVRVQLGTARAAQERRDRAGPPNDAERAFIGYLGGVALREAGAVADARATFTLAMAAAPGTIGEALARRERSHLPVDEGEPGAGAPAGASADEPPGDQSERSSGSSSVQPPSA